jgi:hypothetical protein
MNKRTVKIGSYDTAINGWTLTGCKLSDPEQKTNYVEKSGGDGSWDLSTAMTDGIPRYKNRTLTLTFECSNGSRADRESLLNDMVNQLDGFDQDIVLPDRPQHYLRGRVHVAVDQSSPAYAAITITSNVEPWFYAARETVVALDAPITASTETAIFPLWNHGRRVVSPLLTVDGTANLSFKGSRTTLTTGSYEWPALQLWPGMSEISYLGEGTLTLTYREAVLR